MAKNNMGLGFTFSVRDLASGKIRGLSRVFNQMDRSTSRSAKSTGAAMGAMMGGAVLLGGGLMGLKVAFGTAMKAGTFDQELRFLGKLAKEDGVEMHELAAAANKAAFATQFSPTEAIIGLRKLKTAGFNARQAMLALGPAMDVATFGQISVADASAAVGGALKAFQLPASQAALVADKLAKATALTNLQATEYATALAQASGTAGLFNQTLDDTLIGIGLLRNRNLQASKAATQWRESLRRMGSQQSAINHLKQIGITAFDEEKGVMRDSMSILMEMSVAMKDMSVEQRQIKLTSILGARGIQAYGAVMSATIDVMREGKMVTLGVADAIAHMREQLSDSKVAGFAIELRNVRLDTFLGHVQKLSGTIEALSISIGSVFMPALDPLIIFLKEFSEGASKAINGIPPGFKVIAGAAITMGLAFISLSGTAIILGGILLLVNALGLWPITLGFIALTAAAGALGAMVGIGVVGVFTALTGGGATLAGTLDKLKLAFTSLKEFFDEGQFTEDTFLALGQDENKGVLRFVARVIRGFDRMKSFMDEAFAGFQNFFSVLGGDATVDKLMRSFSDLNDVLFGANGLMGEFTEGTGQDANSAGMRFGFTLARLALIGIDFLIVMTDILTMVLKVVDVMAMLWDSPVVRFIIGGVAGGLITGNPLGALAGAIGLSAFGTTSNGLGSVATTLSGAGAGAAAGLSRGVGPANRIEAAARRERTAELTAKALQAEVSRNAEAGGATYSSSDLQAIGKHLGDKIAQQVAVGLSKVTVHMDGTKVGELLDAKKRRDAARTGDEVPPEA